MFIWVLPILIPYLGGFLMVSYEMFVIFLILKNSFVDASFADIFCHSFRLPFFSLFWCFLLLCKSLNLWLSPICLFLFYFLPWKTDLKKTLLWFMSKYFCLCSLTKFYGLKVFRSLNHFYFCMVWGSKPWFQCSCPAFPSLVEGCLFPYIFSPLSCH